MRIQHNIMAMSAYRNYTNNVSAMKKNLEKLSSGYKINRAGDDAAGLAISEKMRAQITGLETAQKNAKDGISLVQTAEGALTEVHDMLNRMVELATQSANGTYDDTQDRNQLQKEVNQLLDEMNRIADSSNFNGIKLLDGTLGLNTDAFAISSVAANAATDGTIDLSEALAPKNADYSDLHLETKSAAAGTPELTIDLGTLEFVAGKTSDTLTVSIGGNDYVLKASGAKTYKTAGLSGLLEAALKKTKSAGGVTASGAAATAAAAVGIRIGNAAFKIETKSGTTVKLSYMGRYYDDAGTEKFKKETTFSGTQEEADAINASIGKPVEIGEVTQAAGSTGASVTGHPVHDTTTVKKAAPNVPAGLAGIDLDLSAADIVKDGNTITIDGFTMTFKVGADSKVTATGQNLIDLSSYEEGDADLIHAAADLLSQRTEISGKDGRKWKIGVEDGSVIHIEQTAKSNADDKMLKTYDALTGVISAKGKAVAAANAGTKIDITKDALKDGNTLNVGGEKFVYNKNFTDAQSLADAINGNKALKGNYKAEVDGDSVIVRSKAADGNGPTVLGKGLTLQIGDTSDSFNQLNVAVQDMHVDSLGVDKLDISTEEAAQQAIQKIKDAINTVSDVRGTLGATQNRLDHTINNLSVMTENIQDAESTIRDVDVAEEMMAYTKNNILIQSAQAMLAQANQVPQGVLQLLG